MRTGALTEQGESHQTKHGKSYHWYLKRRKARLERRRAKHDPECPPGYRRFRGYET